MKGVRKIVESRFKQRLKESYPDFEKVKCEGLEYDLVHRCESFSGLRCYLILYVDGRKRQFSPHLAVVPNDKSPAFARYGQPSDVELNNNGIQFAISMFSDNVACSWCIREEYELPPAEWDLLFGDSLDFMFTRDQEREWMADHPELYPEPLCDDEVNVFVRVDHMFSMIDKYAIPYFRKMSEIHAKEN